MSSTPKPEFIRWTVYDTPIDPLLAAVSPRGVYALEFDGVRAAKTFERRVARRRPAATVERVEPTDKALAPIRSWLSRYFEGARPEGKELTLDLQGTEFEITVWKKLLAIPMGRTWTYGALADKVGHPGSARAVGGAVGSTPVAVVVPCHRIVGVNGALTGFGGGLPRKRWLLEHEAAMPVSLGI